MYKKIYKNVNNSIYKMYLIFNFYMDTKINIILKGYCRQD